MDNPFKAKLAAGQRAYGTMMTMPSPHFARAAVGAGLDWLLFDLEHSPIDPAQLHGLIAATAGTHCAPLVRVPLDRSGLIRQALDTGASGLVFPLITSTQDVEDAIALTRYPPAGTRGIGPMHAALHLGVSMPEYLAFANEYISRSVLIEDVSAIDALEDILAVPGLDCAIIAPFDLSASMARPGDLHHSDVRSAIAHAERVIAASPVALGGLASSAEDAANKRSKGYQLITLGYDTYIVHAGLSAMIARAEETEG